MHVSPIVAAAMERVEERADDVRLAYSPGAVPAFDDVARAQTSYPTLDALAVAAPDGATFVLGSASSPRFTRDGTFTLRSGTLCSTDGAPVLGLAGDALRPITVDSIDRTLGRVERPRIDARGELLYDRTLVDPRTGARSVETVAAGRIALARFPAGTRLDGEAAPAGVVPHYGRASDGTFGSLATMRRAGSGIDIDRGLDRLREAYRELDALQGAFRTQYAIDKTTMDVVK